jgi:LAO/AO transport system kinase
MQFAISSIIDEVKEHNYLNLSKCISFLENQQEGSAHFVAALQPSKVPVIGITGPPGAGKSTLIAALIGQLVNEGNKVAVLSVDPSSILHNGALLGDRVRMREWYLHPMVYIRSLASRGHLGGLIQQIESIVDLIKSVGFDYVILETVGVGQSEVQVVKVASPTILVLVPEAGDDIQMMKSGLFEVANIFVVNKSDRPEALKFVNHLRQALSERAGVKNEIVETIANTGFGVTALVEVIKKYNEH